MVIFFDFYLAIIDRVIGWPLTILRCQLNISDQISVHGILHSFLVELFTLTMLQAVQIGLNRADHVLLLLLHEMSSVGLNGCIIFSLFNSIVILSCPICCWVEGTITTQVFILVCQLTSDFWVGICLVEHVLASTSSFGNAVLHLAEILRAFTCELPRRRIKRSSLDKLLLLGSGLWGFRPVDWALLGDLLAERREHTFAVLFVGLSFFDDLIFEVLAMDLVVGWRLRRLMVVSRWVELIWFVCWLDSLRAWSVLHAFELGKASFNVTLFECEGGVTVQAWCTTMNTLPWNWNARNARVSILEDAW